ncbi:hypothetical protein [Ferruginibacter albus]|uniref:hypothetical protein n=1 Tax=Ferruginibacter albus TaxID=2875540 RepID=UPI001CC4CD69|nr:hypothetical protein [Ferruginibacter albus]UAY52605.1 hypothetical protein K9M53_02680 [Ferruginibacter albus]
MNLLKSLLLSFVVITGLIISGCSKDSPSGGTTQAVYTLGGAPGACAGFTLGAGNYIAGTALGGTNTVTISVTVTTAGTYSFTTATVNGIKFSANGTFSSTGAQTVTLAGSGTPTASGSFSYSLTGGSSTCTFSVDVTSSGTGAAAFTLGGGPGNCSGFTLGAGTYVAGTALSGSNTASLQVNVTTAGTYSITTGNVNGISFSKSGTFASTGTQTVTLVGTGTPAAAGAFNYTATAGSSTCTFSVTATNGAAAFTLGGSPGSCSGFTLGSGTYVVGTALNANNTAAMQVNVTATGSYSISTATVNGISFSKSGTFASTGTQTVTLVGTGTPAAAGAFNYSATAGANSCTFSVTATAAVTNSVQFNACDNDANWEISGADPHGIQTTGQKEGSGWLESDLVSPLDYLHFIYRSPTPVNGNVTEATGQLKFWLYVSDVTQLRISSVGKDPGQIELTSSGQSDFYEYNWSTDDIFPTLHNGWNEVKLDFSAANKTPDGGPDLTKFNLFRIYFWVNSTTHPTLQFGLDDLRIQQK